jgi:hypothetical protein
MPSPVNSVDRGGDRFYHRNGRSYVSVTTILDRLPKVALQGWKDRKLLEDYRTYEADVKGMKPGDAIKFIKGKDEGYSMGTGSVVHFYIESIAKGMTLPMPETDELRGYYEQVHRFMDDYRPTFMESEATVYSEDYGYAGTLDQIVEIGGQSYVCDTKSGKSVWPEVALQLSAYRHANYIGRADGRDDPIPDCDRNVGLVLHIRPDTYHLRTVQIGPSIHRTFLSVSDVYHWTQTESGFVLGTDLMIDD